MCLFNMYVFHSVELSDKFDNGAKFNEDHQGAHGYVGKYWKWPSVFGNAIAFLGHSVYLHQLVALCWFGMK